MEVLFKVLLIAAMISLGVKGYFYTLYVDENNPKPSIRGFIKYFFLGISSIVTFTSALPFFIDYVNEKKSCEKQKYLKYLKFFLALFWIFLMLSIVFFILWQLAVPEVPN
jgi:hypothetical protein